MTEPCEHINPRQVRDLITDALKQGTRKTGILKDGNITGVGPSLTTHPPKGVPIIYAPGPGATPTMTPDASDIRRLVREDRPFVCRAMRIADVNNCRCYSAANHAEALKKELGRQEESEADFKKFFPKLPEPKISMSAAEYEAAYPCRMKELPVVTPKTAVTVWQHGPARDYRAAMSYHKTAVGYVMSDFPDTFVDHCSVKL